MIETLRLLRKDVLITPIKKNEVYNSVIHVVENDEQRESLNFFKVLRVSEEVELVSEGDIILLGMGKHTPPIMVDNISVAVTSEEDIEAIVELGENYDK